MAEAKRRLAAILSADAVGYSRLMEADEEATVTALDQCRQVFRDRIGPHGGRVVDTAGDSVLAVFDSVVEAVRCAIEVQHSLAERNVGMPKDRQMQFRIGVNLGDVVEKTDGTIYGDGVNVAARLENLAGPGGINISEDAFRQVEGKTDLGFQDIGEHQVKNLARPVRAYRVVTDGGAPAAVPARAFSTRTLVAASVAVLVSAGVAIWATLNHAGGLIGTPPTAGPAQPADPIISVSAGPAIAVLPFTNMSGDPDQEYFSDGLTEDIITALSRFGELRVIARNSTFQFKAQAVDVRHLAEELGADYVLEGSVRRSGERLRVNAQLLDARDGTHAWAETFDRKLTATDIFDVQDTITADVVAILGDLNGVISRQRLAETTGRRPEDIASYECVLRAYLYDREFSQATYQDARECLESVVEREPTYVDALVALSYIYGDGYAMGLAELSEDIDFLAESLDLASKAVKLEPNNATAHRQLAMAHFYRHDLNKFYQHVDQAVALNPNDPTLLGLLGTYMSFTGDYQRATPMVRKAFALNPGLPDWYKFTFAGDRYMAGDHEGGLAVISTVDDPENHHSYVWRLLFLGELNRTEDARAVIEQLHAVIPDYTVEDAVTEWVSWNIPHDIIEVRARSLLKAGLPEIRLITTRPVIAVLPFTNMSGDPEQDYFSDGIAEDIITRMSQFQELGVIARNSSFQYKGRNVDVRDVGEALGADYVVEGSVRRGGDTIRVTAQLIDASDGMHIWARTFDKTLEVAEIFHIQDQITEQVAALVADKYGLVMQTAIKQAIERPTSRLSSYDCVLRTTHYLLTLSEATYITARDCLAQVTENEPSYAMAWALRAEIQVDGATNWGDPPPGGLEEAIASAERAVNLAPDLQYGHWALAFAHLLSGNLGRFRSNADRAIALNPNNAAVVAQLGAYIATFGDWERGIPLVNKAIELNPNYPAWINYALIADANLRGDYDTALEKSNDYAARMPDYFWAHAHVAWTLGLMGRGTDAGPALARLNELYPNFANSARAELSPWFSDEAVVNMAIDGLRKAGMDIPELTE